MGVFLRLLLNMVDITALVVVSLVILVGAEQDRVTWDGYSVLELIPRSGEDISWVQGLACRSMTDWVGVGRPAHLLCNRKQARSLKSSARKKGIPTTYVSKHLGREIKKEARSVDQMNDHISDRKVNSDKKKKNKKKKTKNKNVHAIKNNFRHRAAVNSCTTGLTSLIQSLIT